MNVHLLSQKSPSLAPPGHEDQVSQQLLEVLAGLSVSLLALKKLGRCGCMAEGWPGDCPSTALVRSERLVHFGPTQLPRVQVQLQNVSLQQGKARQNRRRPGR